MSSAMKIALLPVAVVAAVVVGYVTCNCQKETVLTYNTGLTTTVHGYDQRRSPVGDAIAQQGSEADFMCLQELWFEEDMKDVLGKVGSDFPHHYSAIHHSVGNLRADPRKKRFWKPVGWDTSPCSSWKLGKFLICYGWHCRNAANGRKCMQEKCDGSLYDLSQNCRSCVSAASSGFSHVRDKCANVFKEFNRLNRPGLVILSKKPLTDVKYVNFHPGFPVLLERGYIKAKTAGGLTYVCSHLTSVFPFYFEGRLTEFSSFKEEQEDEILKLNSTFYGTPHVLMGDLNTGPARNESGFSVLKAEVPENYDLLTKDLLYENLYLQNDGRCTYCSSENLVLKAEKSPYGDLAIDHVMNSPGVNSDVTSAKRVFDRLDKMLSDHFGVQQDVCLP